jgi:hypothetical protein
MSKRFSIGQKSFDPKIELEWYGTLAIIVRYIKYYFKEKYTNFYSIPYVFIEIKKFNDENPQQSNFYLKNIFKIDKTSINNEHNKFYKNTISEYQKTEKRFTLIPISTDYFKNDERIYGNSSLLLYDKLLNQVEIFDSFYNNYSHIKKQMNIFIKNVYGKKVKIRYPRKNDLFFTDLEKKYCPYYYYSDSGFCVLYVIWYVELRLRNKHLSKDEINKKLKERVKKNPKIICDVINGYIQFTEKLNKQYKLKRVSDGATFSISKNKYI